MIKKANKDKKLFHTQKIKAKITYYKVCMKKDMFSEKFLENKRLDILKDIEESNFLLRKKYFSYTNYIKSSPLYKSALPIIHTKDIFVEIYDIYTSFKDITFEQYLLEQANIFVEKHLKKNLRANRYFFLKDKNCHFNYMSFQEREKLMKEWLVNRLHILDADAEQYTSEQKKGSRRRFNVECNYKTALKDKTVFVAKDIHNFLYNQNKLSYTEKMAFAQNDILRKKIKQEAFILNKVYLFDDLLKFCYSELTK